MGNGYCQLTLDERIEIFRLQSEGRSHREISRMMGRHHTTIMRELGRNSLKSGYKPAMADRMALARCKRTCRLELAAALAASEIRKNARLREAAAEVGGAPLFRVRERMLAVLLEFQSGDGQTA
jgi:IS30 family transposase